MLKKGVFPYEYMDEWEKFNERLPGKEEFYSNISMEDNTGVDRMHAKRVCKNFRWISWLVS